MRRLIQRYARIETLAVLVAAWLAGALGLGLATDAGPGADGGADGAGAAVLRRS